MATPSYLFLIDIFSISKIAINQNRKTTNPKIG